MSHVVTVKAEIKSLAAVKAACKRLKLEQPQHQEVAMYSRNQTGQAIQLPGWRYPVVVKDDGSIAYDNYNGRWGEQQELDKFLQAYSTEAAAAQMRSEGYTVSEQQMPNGQIKLNAQVYS